ncbi:hypothetical protein DH2020_020278 [Rehmannia glutinosa]|uniref:PH domain-containing protein n=1 Tax=Rehmannia glutinosa TaxID=99300 RepID=A0ABR0WH55_REHGL
MRADFFPSFESTRSTALGLAVRDLHHILLYAWFLSDFAPGCINVYIILLIFIVLTWSCDFSHSSLRGKHLYQLPADFLGNVEHLLAVGDAESPNVKVVEDANALIFRCDSENSKRTWQSYLQGAIYRASGTTPVTGLNETLSDLEDSEVNNPDSTNSSTTEKLFLTGILDELKISFSYCSLHDQNFMKMLLAEEKQLLEFRAIGGHVELSIRENDIFIGTVLKALEIEDLVCRKGTSQFYVARSFIRNADAPSLLDNTNSLTQASSNFSQCEGDDEFYEASENLNDSVGSPLSPGDEMEHMSSRIITQPDSSDLKAPRFMRVAGVLPFDVTYLEAGQMGVTDELDSFVKAQIVIFDQNSPLYSSVDKQRGFEDGEEELDEEKTLRTVAVTLSTLSFYCRRPTILAIMEFVNSINIQEDSFETLSDTASTAVAPHDTSKEIVNDGLPSAPMEEPVVKSLLGKGKSRVIFYLLLNMARAEIFLMKENESKLATLAQDNFLTDIKVFPSSFSIKASLGNLRISDDSLHSSHIYFWACDMRNPGGNSFVELVFCSFSADDDDYEGYDYSLLGELSEVRIVYLNRFLQEVISYLMGLVPSSSKDVIQIEDQVTNSQKWLTRSEIEGSPAVKLDLSLKKPIIVMPQRTNSLDYLKLDVVQITVKNTFRWLGGSKSEIKAVHVEILEIRVEDINLNVGSGSELGESIIQDVKGVSFVIQRSLRDLLHQVPSVEVAITIEELKAALSNKEYEIIIECAQANISETPNFVPSLKNEPTSQIIDVVGQTGTQGLDPARSESQATEILVATKVSVHIDMVELCLHYGVTRDASLATLQVSGVWLLYKSNTVGEGSLSATLKDLIVVDDREGTEKELRLAIGKPELNGYNPSQSVPENMDHNVENNPLVDSARKYTPAILILDAKFYENSMFISLCIQRPQLLVALDFLLAIVEFFVPTVRGELSNDENANSSHFLDALILDQPIFCQPSAEFSISPQKPLVADDERFDLFIYDGRGGTLYLKDRQGLNLSCPSMEALVYVGNGKKLQFKNVTIRSGSYLDSCILLGANSSYSANENDNVFMEGENGSPSDNSSGRNITTQASQNTVSGRSTELIFELQSILDSESSHEVSLFRDNIICPGLFIIHESKMTMSTSGLKHPIEDKLFENHYDDSCLQCARYTNNKQMQWDFCDLTLEINIGSSKAIGPELTFYNKSKNAGQNILSNKLLHAQMDTFCSHFERFYLLVVKPYKWGLLIRAVEKKTIQGVGVRLDKKLELNIAQAVAESACYVLEPTRLSCTPLSICEPTGNGLFPISKDLVGGYQEPTFQGGGCDFLEALHLGPLVLNGNTVEMSAEVVDLTMESNGIKILEPFDASMKFSNASEKTSIHLVVSDIFMNFSFSILRLFLAVEEDILSFLRTTSKKSTVLCSEFDRIGTIKSPVSAHVYAFWRPRAPTGFAVLGDYLTPIDKPPTKGVLAVNTSLIRVKRPKSFTLVWALSSSSDVHWPESLGGTELTTDNGSSDGDITCSIWLPEAPKGYVALGCVASPGRAQPPISSVFCILASLVSPCGLRDCISIGSGLRFPNLAFWRVDNAFGTFLPADPGTLSLMQRAYELRHLYFGFWEISPENLKGAENQASTSVGNDTIQSERSSTVNSRRRFETVATFRLIWWNQGSGSRKKLSIWRPVVPEGMVYFGDIAVQGYEPPNTCVVFQDSENYDLYKAPSDFQLVGHIKRQRKMDNISFWMPQAPPGFVTLGCIACKGTPKQSDFTSLRCIRTDMVSTDQFLDESIWDTSDSKFTREPFSIWTVGNELGTFIVWNGLKKPPKRFALKLSGPDIPSGSDDTVIDAEIRTFSAALFDDYGGLVMLCLIQLLSYPEMLFFLWFRLMIVPLCNISLSGIGFSSHGRPDCLKSSVIFSLAARSYNDKYDSWEPLIEPVDGSLRYQNNPSAPGVASELRIASTGDLNLNVSVSNANMILQAYASWNNLSHVQDSHEEANSQTSYGRSIVAVHQKRSYYIVPQNKLGKNIFIRASALKGLPDIIKMPAGDRKALNLPAPKNMLDSHLKGSLLKKLRLMVTIIVAEAELLKLEGLSSHQYSVGLRVYDDQSHPSPSHLNQQIVRTRGTGSDDSESSEVEYVKWNEVFFFKVDSVLFSGTASRTAACWNSLYSHKSLSLSAQCLEADIVVTEKNENQSKNIMKQDPNGYLEWRFRREGMGIFRCEPVGYCSSSLKQLTGTQSNSNSKNGLNEFIWLELFSGESMLDGRSRKIGKIRCSVFLPPITETENFEKSYDRYRKPGSIQISPTTEGPWTTVRLNYGSPVACWRLGNDVVASEVRVNDGNRYVNIRSLVSVRNNTDFTLDFCLKLRSENGDAKSEIGERKKALYDGSDFATDELFESQKYNTTLGWVPSTNFEEEVSEVDLPSGWEWVDEWRVDNSSVNTVDGWVYAPDFERLKWPESYNSLNYVNYARQRRWIRNRNQAAEGFKSQIIVGPVKPGETTPLPLPCLGHSAFYVLHLKPSNMEAANQYSWSSVTDMRSQSQDVDRSKEVSEICVSTLTESEKLLYCSGISGSSSNSLRGIWFCLSIQATEIAKDIHFNPIQDWTIVVRSPVSIVNYLPFMAEISLLEMQGSGDFLSCYRGVSSPGESVKVYNADIRNPLYFTLLPQGGWLPLHEAIPLSHPSNSPSNTISLRSSVSGRIVQIILEQNHTLESSVQPRFIKVYSPYWFGVARCPPLAFRLVDVGARRSKKNPLSFQTKRIKEVILEEITEEETREGYTIASALNFKSLALAASIDQSGGEQFGPVKDLSPLGDMDGSLDLFAYNADGNCMQLFVSSKPCPYQSVPTKVISVRPFMTFTNRVGQNLLLKFSSEDEPKHLRVSDTRVSFVHRKTDGPNEIQVRLHDTDWSFPIQIVKEDTVSLALKKHDATRRFLRTEIRGYEEGSRFIVVFRLGSTNGPIRKYIINRLAESEIFLDQINVAALSAVSSSPLPLAVSMHHVSALVIPCLFPLLFCRVQGLLKYVVRFPLTVLLFWIENRTRNNTIRVRQTGFGDDAWIQLQPLSTANFSWEDPYGQAVIDTEVSGGSNTGIYKFDLDKAGFSSIDDNSGLCLHVANIGDIKVVRFVNLDTLLSKSKEGRGSLMLGGNWGNTRIQAKMPEQGSPLELILELGVIGISVVDHRPRELAYLYVEKLFLSYSTGYDGMPDSLVKQSPVTLMLIGIVEAWFSYYPLFKLILDYVQLDNQLPLAVMPVLLAPEQTPDVHHPVFKMTITVTDKSWRLNIHEPIIWALVDFFNNLQLDRIPQNSKVTQVDPEIRVDLIDISEVRVKVSLETAPAQRPHGLLGVWGPILSAVGNAFKIQVHLRKVTHRDRFLRKSSVISAIGTRIWRDLIHNPLHLIFSVDVLGMTSSTLASLSKGFAELSTDGQFLQLRSKQVWSRRITGVGDGIVQGTEALAQGFAFGVSGVVRKPVENARQNGLLGLAHGLGQAFLGFFVQPMSGALDFFSLTVDGIGASCSRCLEILNNKKNFQRIRNPRAFHADHVLREYSESEALGQMILYLAEASRNFGCTEIFKEPSKFAWSDCYEEHFVVPYQRIVLVTNRRVMLLQCVAPDRMDKRPCKIMWDVPWEEVMTLELAKAGYPSPTHLIIHLKSFRRGESFVRVIKCNSERLPEEREPQAVKVCSSVYKMWKTHQNSLKQVPSSQRHVPFTWSEIDVRESHKQHRAIITSTDISSSGFVSNEQRFVEHSINFSRIWSSERESKGRCALCRKQSLDSDEICSIWRPVCPDGYVSIGDIARSGSHPPTVAAIYRNSDKLFVFPVGYDLVWRNCLDDYKNHVSIWHPRAPEGYVSLGCVAVSNFAEPELDFVYCVAESLCEETTFEEQKIWSAPDSYPWACHVYQSRTDALHFVALRQPREESDWKPKRVIDNPQLSRQTSDA